MKNSALLLTSLILFLFLFVDSAVDVRHSVVGSVLNVFGSDARGSDDELARLKAENLNLRGELQLGSPTVETKSEEVRIYSSYPFNTRNEVVIEGGENVDINTGDTVTFEEKVLFGIVSVVNKKTSLVKTIYDGDVEISVKIGDRGFDALLTGGTKPQLTLIGKDNEINSGDIIISADSKFPFGLVVGTVEEVKDNPEESFKSASISIPYIIRDLSALYVIR